MSHTPGPFHITEARGPSGEFCFYEIRNSDNQTIASTWPSSKGEPDARLFAATPDLLAALKVLADFDHDPDGVSTEDYRMALQRAGDAIAKAEGTTS